MRKTVCITLIIISLIALFVSPASAESNNNYEYCCDDYKIVFDSSDLTQHQIDNIIKSFTEETTSTPYGLTCTLLGHNTTDKEVALEYHNYSTTVPHCKFEIYIVSVCSRCDYTERTWLGTEYANCH